LLAIVLKNYSRKNGWEIRVEVQLANEIDMPLQKRNLDSELEHDFSDDFVS
jgi:hypothetical protein